MSRSAGWWLLAAVVVLSLAGFALRDRFERYEETVNQGPSPEARANPYLAAEQFLRKQRTAVVTRQNVATLPPLEGLPQTLLLLDDRQRMTPSQAERILNWVRSGGRLLLVAEQLWDDNKGRSGDLLLDRLKIRQYLTRDLRAQDHTDNAPPIIPLASPGTPKRNQRWPELTRLYLENEPDPAYFSFDPAFHLDDPQDLALAWANSADATHMLQLRHGNGLVTVLTDADLWKNRAIGQYDNAWLLWYLTQGSAVTLVFNTEHDGLASLLLRYFPHALAALGLILALLAWHAGVRQGGLLPPAPRARRRLTEHLTALADFRLRHSGERALLRRLQADILHRARQRQPGFERLPVAEQWQALSRLTGHSASTIGQALRPRPDSRLSRHEFTRQVADLQTLRNAL